MADALAEKEREADLESDASRVYEIGYQISPSVKEEDVEKIVANIRASIERAHGSFIAEGAPSLSRLSYPMTGVESGASGHGTRVLHDRAYFGWLKFEAPTSSALALEEGLKQNASILRHLLFRTVREETRAHLKAPTLREVRRTDTIKTAPKRVEESVAPVSEADLDKALQDITAE